MTTTTATIKNNNLNSSHVFRSFFVIFEMMEKRSKSVEEMSTPFLTQNPPFESAAVKDEE